ncbi:MAG: hypothetical protein HYX75_06410 [Acidobacteria bacterium]|nr:hypothetical protein [Acidobacteriota bacterium]
MIIADKWMAAALAALALVLATLGGGNAIPQAAPDRLSDGYLPESWEPDDDNVLDDGLRFLREGTLRPGDFIEASLPRYYASATYALVFRRAGDGLEHLFAADRFGFVRTAYRAAFGVTGLCFAAAAVLIYLCARTACGPVASACAALTLILNTGVLVHAHFAVVDLHLLCALSLFLLIALRGGSATLLAAVIGLMASIKYTGGMLFPLVPAVVCMRTGAAPKIIKTALQFLVSAVIFILLNPFTLIDLPRFIHDLGVIHFTRSTFKGFHGGAMAFSTHLTNIRDMSTPLAILSVLAFLYAIMSRRRSRLQVLGVVTFLAYHALTGWSRFNAQRFSLPLVVPLALLIAPLVETLLARAKTLGVALLAAAYVWAGAAAIEADSLFYRDSRIVAQAFIESRGYRRIGSFARPAYTQPSIPPGRGVGLHLAQPEPVKPDLYYRAQELYRRILGRPPAPAAPAPDAQPDFAAMNREMLISAAPDAIVLSSYGFGRYLQDPQAFPPTTRFYEDLIGGRLGYTIVARVRTPTTLLRHLEFVNPEIVVLELRGAGGKGLGARD